MIQKHHYVGGESTHRYTPDTRPKETGLYTMEKRQPL